MAHKDGDVRGNKLLYLAAAVLAVAAFFKLGHASAASGPPQPKATVLGSLAPAAVKPVVPLPTLGHSVPTHIDIDAVNVHADIITVGVNKDDTVGTPPLSNAKVAAWYNGSPTPGQVGASIIDAHVDSSLMADYRGAFYYLGLAKPGMEIDVTRSDHSVAVFTVDEVQDALKADFPTDKVYAATPYPGLRLITCGGDFDPKTKEYLGNTIVYAHMTAKRTFPHNAR